MKNSIRNIFVGVLAIILAGCSGGGGGGSTADGTTPTTYSANSGVAQKGPLLKGSVVTIQETNSKLVPTGKQYSYQIDTDLGTFSPTSKFTSAFLDLSATGYYFDEVTGRVSSGTIVLNGLSDLSADPNINVNLLTTLAYKRIKKLITEDNMSFLDARAKAEAEVLAVFGIRDGNQYGSFDGLDISKRSDGNNILAAISSEFVYGNNSGNLSYLISDFQTDFAANGTITYPTTKAALADKASKINPATVASNLMSKYSELNIEGVSPTDISDWLDQDNDGVVGRFNFSISQPSVGVPYSFSEYVVGKSDNNALYSISNGQFSVNGGALTTNAIVAEGDSIVVTRTPVAHDTSSAYLLSGSEKVACYTFNPFSTAGSLNSTRVEFTMTVLQNGKVLVTGGLGEDGVALSSVELYDPATDIWSNPPSMSVARHGHTATLLNSGKVLVVGADSAELYDPAANVWLAAANYSWIPSVYHTATLLQDGRVLVVGGIKYSELIFKTVVEMYDPESDTWTALPNMNNYGVCYYHSAILMHDGNVLVVGGLFGNDAITTTYKFDPTSETWTTVGSLDAGSYGHTATLLDNGNVLVTGGFGSATAPTRTELFDKNTNTWTTLASLNVARYRHVAQLLDDGRVFVAGGATNGPDLASTETYDPATNTWTGAGDLAYARSWFGAAKLISGEVLLVGGRDVYVTETFK